MYLSPRFLKCQHFRSKGIEILVSTVFNSFSYPSYMCLTLMVTLMALFMLPLHSQPCLETPPFWDPSEAVSCRGRKSRSHTVNSPGWHCAHSERGVRLRIAVPAEGKYHTAFSIRRYRMFRVISPPPVLTQLAENLWCCSMRWNRAKLDAALPPLKQAEKH